MAQCYICQQEADDSVCQRCDEPTCEDCSVMMTYHNQIDYTCCGGCSDEETHGSWNKRNLKPKLMKAITTVSPLQEIPREVLNAWSNAGDNWKYDESKDWKAPSKVWGSNPAITNDTVKSISSDNSFIIKSCDHIKFRLAGFINFHNEYYKLTQPKLAKEQFLNCKLVVPTEEISLQVQEKLKSIGYSYPNNRDKTSTWARSIGIRGYNEIKCGSGQALDCYSSNMKVITYQDIFGYDVQPQQDYDNIRVYCPTEEIWHQAQEKFWELGWLFYTDKSPLYQRNYSYSSGPWLGTELYGTKKSKQLQVMSNYYAEGPAKERRVVHYSEILNQPQINKSINITPQTYDKGQSIIVPAKVASITRGQTITGHFTPGRKCRATVKVGHLSNRRISG